VCTDFIFLRSGKKGAEELEDTTFRFAAVVALLVVASDPGKMPHMKLTLSLLFARNKGVFKRHEFLLLYVCQEPVASFVSKAKAEKAKLVSHHALNRTCEGQA